MFVTFRRVVVVERVRVRARFGRIRVRASARMRVGLEQ